MLLNSLGWSSLSPAFCKKKLISVFLMYVFFSLSILYLLLLAGVDGVLFLQLNSSVVSLWCHFQLYSLFKNGLIFIFNCVVCVCLHVGMCLWMLFANYFFLPFMNKEILCTILKEKKIEVNHKWFWTLATSLFQAWKRVP